MKTAIILSDTHGNKNLDKLKQIMAESDYIFHLGDTSSDGGRIRAEFPDKTIVINGNCDPFHLGENEVIVQVEDIKILATHGHRYSVKSTRKPLAEAAKRAGCRIALYGHTHRAAEDEIDGVACLNPGTLSRYSAKSYGYLVINGNKFTYTIVNIE